jgi:hypothetical protein
MVGIEETGGVIFAHVADQEPLRFENDLHVHGPPSRGNKLHPQVESARARRSVVGATLQRPRAAATPSCIVVLGATSS